MKNLLRYEHKTVYELSKDVERAHVTCTDITYESRPGASVVEIYMNIQHLKYGHRLVGFSVTAKTEASYIQEVFHFVWEIPSLPVQVKRCKCRINDEPSLPEVLF